MSQEAFGMAGGVKKGAQYNYELGNRSPDSSYLLKIQGVGVDLFYLFSGVRSSDLHLSDIQDDENMPENFSSSVEPDFVREKIRDYALLKTSADVASIPMYDVECAAGSGRSFEGEQVLGYFHMDRAVLCELKLPPDSGAWVRARGDSMVGTIDDGDYVFVDFSQRDPSREGVYLVLMDGERRIKRMQRVAGGGWLLISDNPRYDKELIAPEKKQFLEVLGRCLVNLGQVL